MPKVSLLLPTYEPHPEHLRAAIDSALSQTCTDWELLIHDDCSKTDVKAILEPYLKDSRIRFIRSTKNLGIGGNWNACRTQTSAPFVQYLFQDDVLDPTHLEKALKILKNNPSIGFVALNHHYQIEGDAVEQLRPIYAEVDKVKREHLKEGTQDRTEFLTWWISNGLRPNVIGEPSFVMIRRSLMDQVGMFNEQMRQGLDVDYWLRLLLKTDWYYIQQPLGFFRVHASAATAQNAASGLGLFDRMSFYDLLIRSLPVGPLRNLTKESLTDQFALMARKFFSRVSDGKKVAASGSGSFVIICLRHPLLVMKGIQKYRHKKN